MAPSPSGLAQGLADHFNRLLNETVSQGRLYIADAEGYPGQFEIRCGEDALGLNGSDLAFWIYHRVAVDDRTHTQQYSYRVQTRRSDRKSWLLRWEYYRTRPADNPHVLRHVHVRSTLEREPEKGLSKLHIPTDRVPLELVLWHLIADWDVRPIQEGWEAALDESLDKFADLRNV